MTILVICSGGMSTSMLVKSMRKASEELKKEIIIESAGVSALKNLIKDCDIVLVAPQIKHRITEINNIANNKPVILIDHKIYGLIDGKGAMKQAMNELPGG